VDLFRHSSEFCNVVKERGTLCVYQVSFRETVGNMEGHVSSISALGFNNSSWHISWSGNGSRKRTEYYDVGSWIRVFKFRYSFFWWDLLSSYKNTFGPNFW